MLSLDTILKDTMWVGKYYNGGRITGTYEELEPMKDEFRDFDIMYHQPDHLKEFYKGYFNQSVLYSIQDYYNHIYSKKPVEMHMYEVSYISNEVAQANIYIGESEEQVVNHFKATRSDCQFVGIRETTYTKPGQSIKNLTRGGN